MLKIWKIKKKTHDGMSPKRPYSKSLFDVTKNSHDVDGITGTILQILFTVNNCTNYRNV